MVINENLALNNFKDGETKEDTDRGYTYFLIADLPDLNLNDGDTYTVSFNLEQSAKGCGQFNAGPLSIPNKERPQRYLMSKTNYEVKDRSYFSFIYSEDTQSSIVVYTDLVSRNAGVGGTIKNVKIEKGDKMTPYIPSKNSIETAKRQYFIGGGTTKKSFLSDKRRGVC